MPFKIVETIEKGKPRLCIVPSKWERKGLLRWPPKKTASSKLVRDENSIPSVDWVNINCTLKRSAIPSYQRAEEVINIMTQHSDTDGGEVSETQHRHFEEPVDYNNMTANLACQPNSEPEASTSSIHQIQLNQTPKEIIEIVTEDGQVITTAFNNENPNVDKLLVNQKNILENQNIIMQNQSLLHETQNALLEQEKKNFRQLQNLSVQLDYSFTRFNPQSEHVTLLNDANQTDTEPFMLKPMSTIEELQDFEEKLADKAQNKRLQRQYSLLCSKVEGSGTNCSYKLLDILFTREFLCQCSWSGGSRGNVVKIALKGYKRFLQFFFQMINSWDPSYTHSNMESFFKTVLKNSVKRLQIKNIRASCKRSRQGKVKMNKRQKTVTETVGSGELNEDVLGENNGNEESPLEVIDELREENDENLSLECSEEACEIDDKTDSQKNQIFKETSV